MKTIDTKKEIEEAFIIFQADRAGAYATCRLLQGANSAMDPQEWAEHGQINGTPAKVYYLFSEAEASDEDATNYPWDTDHISKIEIAEKDEEGEYDDL